MAASTKVAIVTGSNKGVGLAIVRGLFGKFEGDIYLTSRNQELGEKAVKLLEAEKLSPKYHQLDIASETSVASLKKFMVEKYGGVDVLINNAGIAFKSASTAPALEQASVTFAINVDGTLNMMKAFFPIMKPHGRIVNVSSMVGKLSNLGSQALRERFTNTALTIDELVAMANDYIRDVKEGKDIERGWGTSKYSNSKVVVTAMTKVYAREMEKSGKEDILINACCPGWVRTDMAGDKATLSPDQGAETPIHVALLPPGSPNGEFWTKKAVTVW